LRGGFAQSCLTRSKWVVIVDRKGPGMDEEVEKRFIQQNKRFDDRLRECKKDVDLEFDSITQVIKQIQADVQAMKEILEAWNNMKGFASGMRFVSAVIKILTPIVVLIGGAYFALKTGSLPHDK